MFGVGPFTLPSSLGSVLTVECTKIKVMMIVVK